MMLVRATLVRVDMEPGWRIVGDDVPLGKVYFVAPTMIRPMVIKNLSLGKQASVDCIWVAAPGRPGWLPLLCFKLEE